MSPLRSRASLARVAEWQTQRTQNPPIERSCGFESHLGHWFLDSSPDIRTLDSEKIRILNGRPTPGDSRSPPLLRRSAKARHAEGVVNSQRARVWSDVTQPTPTRYGVAMTDGHRVSLEMLAHDLAMVYLNNRYGPEVSGDLDESSTGDSTSLEATVSTYRLPGVGVKVTKRVPTGEKMLFGLMDRKKLVDTDEFQVDATFRRMMDDYEDAYGRFLQLLSERRTLPPPSPST